MPKHTKSISQKTARPIAEFPQPPKSEGSSGRKRNLLDPFDPLYRGDELISDRPEIQEINEYALGLDDKIEGDFDLDWIEFEFFYNRLAYIRNGLVLAKLKFMKLYKDWGDGTFASFCRDRLHITRWQINDNIKAARVAMELIYAGFEQLPGNISQAIALASLTGEELVEAWSSVIDAIAPDKITHKSIKSFLFPPTIDDLPDTSIRIPPTLHESIHNEAAERGLSIANFVRLIFDFFISGGDSHLLSPDVIEEDYAQRERRWQEDLQDLIAESGRSTV